MGFCPKCGNKDILDVLCENCYKEEHSLVEGFKEVELVVCALCNKFQSSNKWISFSDVKDALIEKVRESVKFNLDASMIEMVVVPILPEYKPNAGVNVKGEVEVTVKGKLHPKQKKLSKETYMVPVIVSFTSCPLCSRKGTQYFEGTLQLRNPSEELMNYVREDFLRAEKKGIYVTKEVPLKNGIDFLMTDQRYMRRLGLQLKKRFKGELKTSRKLFTRNRQTQKEVFRVTVMFRQ